MRIFLKVHHYICTAFVFLFVYLLFSLPAQFDRLDPISSALSDFEFTDVVFSQLRNEAAVDTNIVLVNIAHLSRAEIGRQVQILQRYQPKVIGIDAFFRAKKDFGGDIQLIMAMAQVPNLVLVTKLSQPRLDGLCFDSLETSHLQFSQFGHSGFANMVTAAEGYKTTREFTPQFCLQDSQALSFAIKIAQLYDSTATERVLQRGNETEPINWRGNYKKFFSLDAQQVLKEDFDSNLVRNKIVLMGFLGRAYLGEPSLEDTFFTPLNETPAGKTVPDMFGVTLHANIISMVLHGNYIETIPLWLQFLIAFVLVYLNVSLFFWIGENHKVYYDLITKSLQLLEAIILLWVSVVFLLYFDYKIDLTLAIVTILLSGDLTELYVGSLRPLGYKFVKRFKKS